MPDGMLPRELQRGFMDIEILKKSMDEDMWFFGELRHAIKTNPAITYASIDQQYTHRAKNVLSVVQKMNLGEVLKRSKSNDVIVNLLKNADPNLSPTNEDRNKLDVLIEDIQATACDLCPALDSYAFNRALSNVGAVESVMRNSDNLKLVELADVLEANIKEVFVFGDCTKFRVYLDGGGQTKDIIFDEAAKKFAFKSFQPPISTDRHSRWDGKSWILEVYGENDSDRRPRRIFVESMSQKVFDLIYTEEIRPGKSTLFGFQKWVRYEKWQ